MTDKTISEKCETLYNKLNSFVTSVINRDVTPQINNLESSKANTVHNHNSDYVIERKALSNIGTSVYTSQSVVNRAVDEKVGSLSTSITNIMGFKLVHTGATDKIRVYSNGLLVYFTMQGTFTMSANADTNAGTIPSQYAPNVTITVATHPNSTNKLAIQDTGTLIYHNFTSNTSVLLRVGVMYPLRASLP